MSTNKKNIGENKTYANEFAEIFYKEFVNGFTDADLVEGKEPHSTGDFMCNDIIGILTKTDPDIKSFIVIYDVTTKEEHRNQGHGINILKEFIDNHSEEFIAARSCALQKHYPDCPSEEEMSKIIEKGFVFLEKFGFININDYCQLEYSIPCVYPNKKSENFLARVREIVDTPLA